MKIHSIDGKEFEISREVMKQVADSWWEQYGKSEMVQFYSDYQKKAAINIRCAVRSSKCPENEKEVKEAIAEALASNDAKIAAEVLFEAMEWETAYSNLESVQK
jgi:hypothetical protein